MKNPASDRGKNNKIKSTGYIVLKFPVNVILLNYLESLANGFLTKTILKLTFPWGQGKAIFCRIYLFVTGRWTESCHEFLAESKGRILKWPAYFHVMAASRRVTGIKKKVIFHLTFEVSSDAVVSSSLLALCNPSCQCFDLPVCIISCFIGPC